LADAERLPFDLRVGIDRALAESFQQLFGAGGLRASVERAAQEPVLAEVDVVDDRAGVDRQDLLVDDGDAPGAHPSRRSVPDLFAFDRHGAGVDAEDAADQLHQRALAGAVLADDGVDFPRRGDQVHRVQRLRVAEGLARPDDLQARPSPSAGGGAGGGLDGGLGGNPPRSL
jgi:hypothetical protein